MSGLNYDGIPENLRNMFPFPYNDLDYLKRLIEKKILELSRWK